MKSKNGLVAAFAVGTILASGIAPATAAAEIDDYRQCGKGQAGCTGARAVKIDHETESGHSVYQNNVRANEDYGYMTIDTREREQRLVKDDGSWQVAQSRQTYTIEFSDGFSCTVSSSQQSVRGEMISNKSRTRGDC